MVTVDEPVFCVTVNLGKFNTFLLQTGIGIMIAVAPDKTCLRLVFQVILSLPGKQWQYPDMQMNF